MIRRAFHPINPLVRRGLPALALSCALASPTLAQRYKVIDLGSLAGPTSAACDVNSTRQVVGYAAGTADGSEFHAFRWSNSMTDLGTLGGDPQSAAFAINSSGVIVGVSYALGDLQPRAFRWDNGVKTNLGAFVPRDINLAGDVVGIRTMASGVNGLAWIDRACIHRNGVLTTLGTLGGSNSYAYGISDAGEVVGSALLTNDQTMHAFRWNGGALVDLGTLGGTMSQAYAINNRRQITGMAETATGQPHAFRITLDASGGIAQKTDLGDLGNGGSCGYGINDAGTVVGASDGRAFLWNGRSMIDLNTRINANSGWQLAAATAINRRGDIVGYGRHLGVPHAFLLRPRDEQFPLNVLASDGQFNPRVRITWSPLAGADDYQVERRELSGGAYVIIADHVVDTSYNDRDAAACRKYRYRIRAWTAGELGPPSAADIGWRGSCAPLLRLATGDSPGGERAGDLNQDGLINVDDLLELIIAAGSCERCPADLNDDGAVDDLDVALLLAAWD